MSEYFIFDDIDTRDYEDIYVTFDNVDRTPKRVYEEVEIPARNGLFYIDKDRYEDVEHIYHVIALTKEAGSELINALASKIGYHRLEDSFNTDEYYEAVFTSGAELKITAERDKNTFKITFTRKPQRFLTSGETEVSVANNGTLTNPTLFESKPLLQIWGYGDIQVNDDIIDITSEPIGTVQVLDSYYFSPRNGVDVSRTFDDTLANTGDRIYELQRSGYLDKTHFFAQITTKRSSDIFASVTQTYSPNDFYVRYEETSSGVHNVEIALENISFSYGTSATFGGDIVFNYEIADRNDPTQTTTVVATFHVSYTYDENNTVTFRESIGYSSQGWDYINVSLSGSGGSEFERLYLESSKTTLGSPLYFDLDIGEAYKYQDGAMVSVNNGVSFPSKLPTLKAGSNVFKYPNTITQFKVVPRWWKV